VSRGCPGLHCPGCGDGGGGLAALIVVLVVIGAVIHAIWHTLVEVAEIAAWTVLGAAGLAAIAGLVYAAVRVRASVTTSRPGRVIPAEVIRLGTPARDAIDPPRAASWPLPGTWEEIKPDTDRSTS